MLKCGPFCAAWVRFPPCIPLVFGPLDLALGALVHGSYSELMSVYFPSSFLVLLSRSASYPVVGNFVLFLSFGPLVSIMRGRFLASFTSADMYLCHHLMHPLYCLLHMLGIVSVGVLFGSFLR